MVRAARFKNLNGNQLGILGLFGVNDVSFCFACFTIGAYLRAFMNDQHSIFPFCALILFIVI